MILMAAVLLSKHLWEAYAPMWLNSLTSERVALLGIISGTATVAAIARIVATPGNPFSTTFVGVAGISTFGAGYVQISSGAPSWQEEFVVVLIGLTLVPAFPGVANRIYGGFGGVWQLIKSREARFVGLVVLLIISVLMAEWVHEGYIDRMRAVFTAVGWAIVRVGGGLLALLVVAYMGWLVYQIIRLCVSLVGRCRKALFGRQDVSS